MDTNPHDPLRDPGDKSVGQLFSDLTSQLTTLVKQEVELIKAETAELADLVSKGVGELAAGTICLLAALLVLLQALVAALSEMMHPAWASLGVGVLVAVIGVILLQKGKKDVKNVTPSRTVRQAERTMHVGRSRP